MCAIAGVLGYPVDSSTEEKMLSTMKRRGPDGNGVYENEDITILHARLSIIDPQGGKQPMKLFREGETFVITYNGELYNAGQLRKELESLGHTFSGHSDTEVLLHAYAQWREGCLEKLNGIYAFAVYEERTKRLFLARDRIGVKPLFYRQDSQGLLFASEIKTILAHPAVSAELDTDGIAQLLLLGPGRKPGSGVFRGVRELEPGMYGIYENGKLSLHRYWKLKDREHRESFGETSDHVRQLLVDAILRQTVSDVPVGTFLSGGLDSSLISSVCAKEFLKRGERLHTFSVDYQDNDKFFTAGKFQPTSDPEYIRLMAEYLDASHHWTVLTPGDLMDAIEDTTIARDLPGMADVDTSLQLFCGQIKPHVTVALSGECADEIFGGYPWYRDPAVRDTQGFPWAQNTAYRASFLPGWVRLDPESYVGDLYRQTVSQADVLPGTDPVNRRMKEMVNLNFRWFMQTLLDRKDRMSMYHGLEVRVPFCDHRIAEYLYSVPWDYKDYAGREKGLLRHAMRDYLPEAVLHRKKSPYPKTHHPLYLQLAQDKLRTLLSRKDAPIFQIVSRQALQNLLEEDSLWPWYGQLMRRPQTIVYMLQINFWLEHYSVRIV